MPDEPGRVPERLREVLRGLRATGDNDVARGAIEDDDPPLIDDDAEPEREAGDE